MRPDADTHHIKTRGAGGGDEPSNIMYLCREHHVEWHKIGAVTFTDKYGMVEGHMRLNGWEKLMGKWRHIK